MPGLPRFTFIRCGKSPAAMRHRFGRGLPNDASGSHPLGEGCARIPSGRNVPHGAKHLRFVSDSGKTADGFGAFLSHTGSFCLYSINGRAPKNATW